MRTKEQARFPIGTYAAFKDAPGAAPCMVLVSAHGRDNEGHYITIMFEDTGRCERVHPSTLRKTIAEFNQEFDPNHNVGYSLW